MARFFLESTAGLDGVAAIGGDDAKHIARVLRMQPGEQIELVALGRVYAAELLTVSPTSVTARLGAPLGQHGESGLEIHLYQALPKSDKMDLIVQKATELGVREITPVISSRVVVKLHDLSGGQKVERWQRIAAEAAKQSRRTLIPVVHSPLPLADVPPGPDRLRLVAWEQSSRPLQALLRNHPAQAVDIVVGPEGGLTADEVVSLSRQGFHSITLGPRILRTETAPLALLAVLQYELGDWGGNN